MNRNLNPLHLVCGDDELRPNLRLIEIKNNTATATNAICIVKIDLLKAELFTEEELQFMNGKFIDREVWKEMHKCDFLEFDDQYIIVTKNGIRKIFEYADHQGSFLNYDSVIIDLKNKRPESKQHISMSAKQIEILRKIFDCNDLIFCFSEGMAGINVISNGIDSMFAILMPIYTPEANRFLFTS